MKLLVASTGGSGCGYLIRLFHQLLPVEGETHWMSSENFFTVMRSEYGFDWSEAIPDNLPSRISEVYPTDKIKIQHKFTLFNYRDIGAPPASGSNYYDAMVILPCSMKTLGAIASGVSSNLIERSADVSLKEKRKLILVPRETPYNLIHIENMRLLTMAGAVIMPASPGFYQRPKTIEDLFDFMVDRIFMQIGIKKRLIEPWENSS
ncbi:MAG: UbiX family flavin prenyltransferase [Spirochaetia bacterium]|nr:UbiX family flavin prenyltransferase [Spirochaetia bacterium]